LPTESEDVVELDGVEKILKVALNDVNDAEDCVVSFDDVETEKSSNNF
jgi:hypothetical protein